MPHRGRLLNGNHIEDTRSYNIKFTSYSKLIDYNHYDMIFYLLPLLGKSDISIQAMAAISDNGGHIVSILTFWLVSIRKWQDYVYIQCEYKSTKQKIKHLLREENKVKENKIS